MRIPLHSKCVQTSIFKQLLFMAVLVIGVALPHSSIGQTVSQVNCICESNGTDDVPTQFTELISIRSLAGESWRVLSATGLYDANVSLDPPADPTPLPDNIGFTPSLSDPRLYLFEALRLSNTDWTLTVSNGTEEIVINSNERCVAPSQLLLGDEGVCIGDVEIYSIAAPNASDIVWSVTGGTIIGDNDQQEVEVEWDMNTGGAHEISFVATAPSYSGQTMNFCDIEGMMTVSMFDEPVVSLACNNIINLSLNGNCDLSVTADMILEDMQYENLSYDVVFRDIEADTIVPGPILDMAYVNRRLEVSVVHDCSGNKCWGYIVMEDKALPTLACPDDVTIDCDMFMTPEETGYPVPPGVIVTKINENEYLAEGFDLCSDVTLRYDDIMLSQNLCDGPYSSIIQRKWWATDNSGNIDTCSHLININRADLGDVEFPENWDDVLGPNPSLQACGDWPMLDNGHPDPAYTGMPTGVLCFNAHVEYVDTRLEKCGDEKTFKLLRKWIVTDVCENEIREQTQYIAVYDSIAPVGKAPEDYTVSTGEHDCSSVIEVKKPTAEDCTEWTYRIAYKPVDESNDPYTDAWVDGIIQHQDKYIISELPSHEGQVWISYYIEDACGNIDSVYNTVTIRDEVQPVPVCDLYTFIGLGDGDFDEDGFAYGYVEAFDDGSHDNCAIDRIEVRRMDNTGCGERSVWSDRVKFCCADVGDTIMVRLRVIDKAGNTNECMVETVVQDNSAPKITYCPGDTTIDCTVDIFNYEGFGMAIAEDNCNVIVTDTIREELNDCGIGIIYRTFIATDDYGNTDFCTQRINVVDSDPFYINQANPLDTKDDVIWPEHVTVPNGCIDSSIDPDQLPAGAQEPVILDRRCSKVSYSYHDVVFQYTDEACFKVLRKWTVLDHCRHKLGTTAVTGEWTYTQVIKVENNMAPEFIIGCMEEDYTRTELNGCTVRTQASVLAQDDCTEAKDLRYKYKIDLNNDGSTDVVAETKEFDYEFGYGEHKVTWYAIDQCGNEGTCEVIFEVKDEKKPTPYCLTEVVTVIMESTGEVEIWASDFNINSSDNCSPDYMIKSSFSPDTTDTYRTIRCADMTEPSQSFEYMVYFTDEAGNSDFCIVNLIVQDNNNRCGNGAAETGDGEQALTLGGSIQSEGNKGMSDMEVVLQADLAEFPRKIMTDGNGEFSFENLAKHNYNLVPSSADDYRNGVNTLDIVFIQRHILKLDKITSPYKLIASDINNDGRINAADLLQLRKLILGIYKEFPKNTSWKYIDAQQEFADRQKPFPHAEQMSMMLEKDYMAADFVAVKIGDVDNSASNFQNEDIVSRSMTNVSIQDEKLAVGYNEVLIHLDDVQSFYGLQLGLALNTAVVSDAEVLSDKLEMDAENFYYQDGKLHVAVAEAIQYETDGQAVLKLAITTKDDVQVSEILTLDPSLKSMIVVEEDDEITSRPLGLELRSEKVSETDFTLYQNVPNPFATTTDISFNLPSDQQATLSVMDITGKLVYQQTGAYKKGYNTITLDISDINASGILHYQIETDTHSDNKKMIVIK